MIKHITTDTFDATVLKAKNPVLIDVWAEWCPPCKAMEPTIDAIAEEFEGKLDVTKLNADEYPEIAQQLDVMSLPTLLIFKDGQPVERHIGLMPKDRLTGVVTAAIA